MKINILLAFGVLMAATFPALAQNGSPKARVTVRAVDEDGMPLDGVKIRLIFGAEHDARAVVPVEGVTGGDGLFTGEGYSDGGYGTRIEKAGYYPSGLAAPKLIDIQDGRWIPWNPVVTTVMRKVGNPVPLCAKTDWIEIPAVGEACGYDLEKGDWTAPHGKGAVADLIFFLQRRYASRRDFEVVVTLGFSGNEDGIQEATMPETGKYSQFKWSREAPNGGYESKLVTKFAHPEGGTYEQTASPSQNYFFRVRTETQGGHIVKAHYGKIAGGLQLAPANSKTCKIKLTYYFNPTPLDRNLEWDTTKNLIQGLSREETPREP